MITNNYQKHYENKAGKASVNIKKAVAGENTNFLLTYETGELGIDNSGGLKVLFRIASDTAEPQFSDEKKENFVRAYSSNKKVNIEIDSRSEGTKSKIGIRPWSRGFCLNFSGSDLKKGDKIYIQFKNYRMQTFCEDNFEFKILVDSFATGKFIELPKSPTVNITHGIPKKLVVIAPSKIEKGAVYSSLVKLEDKWGNPCKSLSGEFEITNHSKVGCPSKIKFKEGKSEFKIKSSIESSEVLFIKARYQSLKDVSNPIIFDSHKSAKKHFWAELHGQSGETVGTNSIDNYFNFGKNYAFIDVLSHQGNDFQVSNDFWKKINNISSTYNKDNEFVTFPGYEWSGNTSKGGDRNIYYSEENQEIHRSSHALVDDYSDIKNDTSSVKELFKKIKNNEKALVVAHVGGRPADINIHEDKVERLVEVHSCWGTFEWFMFEALKKGYVVGFTAGSDGHDGRPGASYPGASHFSNKGGLTCVISKNLDRKNIFEALKNRHCYATTGDRIFLDTILKSNQKILGIMGDVVSLSKASPKLSISTIGTDMIEKIEIFNKDKVIKRIIPYGVKNENNVVKYVKISWKGAKSKGRNRTKKWSGEVQLKKCEIAGEIENINFSNLLKNKSKNIDKTVVVWESETSGNTQAIIVPIQKTGAEKGVLKFKINGKNIDIDFDKIKKESKKYKFDGLDSFVEIYETTENSSPSHIELEEKIIKLKRGMNPIFVKITQRDGNIAWSSPIYIKIK